MTSETWEKAVEAGAEAAALFDHEVFESLCRVDQVAYLDLTKATLRAAFPFLAEELAQKADEIEREHARLFRQDNCSGAAEVAGAIRARIEQMKEPHL